MDKKRPELFPENITAELEQVKEGWAHDKKLFETENCELTFEINKYKEQCTELQSENGNLQKFLQDHQSAKINEIESDNDALNINSLPDEIILEIFGYLRQNKLGQIARVCRRWNVLTRSPNLWKKVDVKISSSHRSKTTAAESFINRLPSCVTSIRLDFKSCGIWIEPLNFVKLCMKLQEKCPHLKELILTDSELSNSLPSVLDLCRQFLQNIKNLVFYCCIFPDCPPSTELGGTSKIEVLDLSWCEFGRFNKPCFSRMPYLKVLCLYGTGICNTWFEDDTSFLNQLHILNVGYTGINSKIFRAMQNVGLNFKELYLCGGCLKDHDLNFDNSTFSHLQTICLSNIFVTGEGVVSLIRSCPSLKNVYVDDDVAESFVLHPFVAANRCMTEIVKFINPWNHNHNVDYLHN